MIVCAADTKEEAQIKPFVASMGMYVFKKDVLIDLLYNKFPEVRWQQQQQTAADLHPVADVQISPTWVQHVTMVLPKSE